MRPDRLDAMVARVEGFNRERDWRKFHSPKNLTMALAIESAELMEPFRWMTGAQSWRAARENGTLRAHVENELADVMLLAVSLANYLGLDVVDLAETKLRRNAQRYPVARARGRADKYTAYRR